MFALVMCQLLTVMVFADSEQSLELKQQLWPYFGTFTRSLFTMFEITFGGWEVIRLLSEHVHVIFMGLTVIYKLGVGVMILGVINGVFMQETFKAASLDDGIMVRQKT